MSAEYDLLFNEAWKLYRAPKCASKKDAAKAWRQVESARPPNALLLLCIEEYLADIAKTKTYKAHFATWLRREGWVGYLDDAKYRLENPVPKLPARKAFRASDYPDPEKRPMRTAAEILAANRG